MKKILSLILSTSLLLACNSAPMFTQAEGEVMTEEFIALLKTDSEAAYEQTSATFQSITTLEGLVTFSSNPVVQHLEDVTITGISMDSAAYSTDYDGPYAQITLSGESLFDDGSIGLVTIIWSYDFDEVVWELDGIDFYSKE